MVKLVRLVKKSTLEKLHKLRFKVVKLVRKDILPEAKLIFEFRFKVVRLVRLDKKSMLLKLQ